MRGEFGWWGAVAGPGVGRTEEGSLCFWRLPFVFVLCDIGTPPGWQGGHDTQE